VGENGAAKKAAGGGDKKKGGRREKNVDMEKLADGLQKLQEDDLLNVVQMVHDGKDPNTYTKNDVESEFYSYPQSKRKEVGGREILWDESEANERIDGEFHVDLYTLPDNLVKQLWDFTASKVELWTISTLGLQHNDNPTIDILEFGCGMKTPTTDGVWRYEVMAFYMAQGGQYGKSGAIGFELPFDFLLSMEDLKALDGWMTVFGTSCYLLFSLNACLSLGIEAGMPVGSVVGV
jgi:hypothetical protein